jgi:NADPH-dependent 2,4-dienoyl-CoA reductase/sulfur reductase-like enzyme
LADPGSGKTRPTRCCERWEEAIRALIIGGGIGGLAAAIALQRVGIQVALFEMAPYSKPIAT